MFYEKVSEYCKQNNISIMAFEVKCGLANGIVGRWRDGSNPTLSTMMKIANATGLPTEYWVSSLNKRESGRNDCLVGVSAESIKKRC